ncbi:SH3 domain-containing protein [Arenibacterium halophilum]|uniref:SH3 domain-containing protein n=1 Tax=Arenibacterium halophilum TaxID=2583821 RepID=A0ABY2XDH8_9RHOB|nr:SH3 domain-containing protein [Arenibacterium halophilum]TMV14642.1 SH3 domain-containing protein [Arenibacterium halophilum]
MRWAAIVVSGTILLAGCAGVMGERAVVTGVGQGDLLKLRYGPSLGYKVKLGLPDGTEVVRRTCVTEMGQLWCEVSLAKDPGVTGYVSADYLRKP